MESKMKKNVFSVIILSLLIFLSAFQVAAVTFPLPMPFEIWSPDGTYVFRWNPDPNDGLYAYAGLYRDGELVYFLEDLPALGVSASNFFFSQDFMHFVFFPPVASTVALEFYSYGQLMKTHYITDLVRDMEMTILTSGGLQWRVIFEDMQTPDGRPISVDHIVEHDILRIKTVDRIIYGFDLTTGAILSYYVVENPVTWFWYAIFVAAGLFAAVVVGVIVAKKKRKVS